MPPHKNRVMFVLPSIFRPPRKIQVKCDVHTEVKSILMPRHQNQVDFDPYTKTKSFSPPTQKKSTTIPALKSSQLDTPHKSQFRSKY